MAVNGDESRGPPILLLLHHYKNSVLTHSVLLKDSTATKAIHEMPHVLTAEVLSKWSESHYNVGK